MDIEIPSQVKTFANLAAFPITGSVKTIYIAGNTNIAYYWTGSAYAPISIQDLSGLFPNPTGNNSQYIRGDGSLETFPSIPDVTGLQSKPVVVSSNITAQNDTVYHVVANATFTDPSPVEGRGYFVVVRNATSCTLGGNSYISGETIYRIFHSGSWLNIAHRPSTYVPTSRTINGYDLSANRTLTTNDIADSTDKRYVTDTQLTLLSNKFEKLVKAGTITGTTSETIVHTFAFSANECPTNTLLHIESQFIRNGTPTANGNIRFRINTSNTLVGSTQLSQANIGGNTNVFSQIRRKFDINGGLIQGFAPNSNSNSDLVSTSVANLSASLDTTNAWWLFVTYQPLSSGDTVICNFSQVKNF